MINVRLNNKQVNINLIFLNRYIKELKNKIELKMIPNKTEEQILYQQFKFYDLESSGFCTLQNFIKANDRLGVFYQN